MEKSILKAYYENPIGINLAAKKLSLEFKTPQNKIREIIKTAPLYQIHNPAAYSDKFFKIVAYQPNEYQADLMFLPNLEVKNGGYGVFLCCVNITSRFAYVVPMKKKSETVESFEEILKKTKINDLVTDNGTEFTSRKFKELMKKNNISHYTATAGDHNKLGIVERFNKTLKQKINKWISSRNSLKFVDYLQSIVDKYNSTEHSSIKIAPKYVTEEDDERIRTIEDYENIDAQKDYDALKIGDKVRVRNKKNLFDKGNPTWSEKIYTIIEKLGKSLILNDFRRVSMRDIQIVNKVSEDIEPTAIEEEKQKEKKTKTIQRNITKELGKDSEQNITKSKRQINVPTRLGEYYTH